MSTVPERALSAAFTQAYYDGFALHGDIDMAPVAFEIRLQAVIEKHVGFNPPVPRALLHMRALHTNDLYLASGCSQPNDRAWRRRSVINECFKVARDSLSDREKTVLLMRFDEGLRIVEIGRHFKLHPTGISCYSRPMKNSGAG